MRDLAIRLVLWLCNRFDIALIDERRSEQMPDAIARAERWEAFAKESGGLYDMIEKQRREAFQAYADTAPDDVATKEHLAMQDRALRQLQARVASIVATGKIEANRKRQNAANVSLFKAA